MQSGKLSLPTLTLERVMTDKKLLELAAKAAGYKHTQWSPLQHPTVRWGVCTIDGIWNPLTDDGDALRLAVKLDMSVISCMEEKEVGVTVLETALEIYEQHNDDPYAATRRAIVRAAAEIGRAM